MEFDPEKTEDRKVIDSRGPPPAIKGFVLVWSGDRPIYETVAVGRAPTWLVSPGGLSRAMIQAVDDGFLVTPIAGRVEVNGHSRTEPSSVYWDSSVRVGDLLAVCDPNLRHATGIHSLEVADRCFGPETARASRQYSRHVEIVGEMSSGKRTFARALHAVFRPQGPFVDFDPTLGVDPQLEAAFGGTLFFRNVDQMPESARELYRFWSRLDEWGPNHVSGNGTAFRVIGSVSTLFGGSRPSRVFEPGQARARLGLPPAAPTGL